MAEIIELDEFEPAFPVDPKNHDKVMRRFSTLFIDNSHPRCYGANGAVNKAQNAFGEAFAVKRLRTGLENTPLPDIPISKASSGAIAAFRNEYESQLAVSNLKGFPKLYGYGKANGEPAIIMEWVEGRSLSEYLDDQSGDSGGRLSPASVMEIGAKVFSILTNLDALSSRPVHRDLSPSNILVRDSALSLKHPGDFAKQDICIIDFGSTTLIDEQNPAFTATTNILRHGTPEYAAPEMLTDSIENILVLRQSPSIDVYAVCSILYQALAGHTPYRIGEHPNEVPYLLKTRSLPDPLSVPGYEDACDAIMRGLSQEQSERPSASEMRDVLLRDCGKSESDLNVVSADTGFPVDVSLLPQKLTTADERASIRDASFAHVEDPGSSLSSNSGNSRKLVSRRNFIALVGGAAVFLLGGGYLAAMLDSMSGHESDDSQTEDDLSAAVPSYTGGTLYPAQEIESKLWGFLNAQRQWVIPPTFQNVPGPFVDGLSLIKDQDTGEYGYINEKGKWALGPKYPTANMFGEGLAFVQASEAEDGSSLGGWIDIDGKWAIKPEFYGGGVFSNGLASCRSTNTNSSRWGYVNAKGDKVIEEQFMNAGSFADNGLALASAHVGQYGWINKKGDWMIKPQYGKAQSFSEGMAGFMDPFSEKWGYIDSSGKESLPAIYGSVRLFKGGLAACKKSESDLWGFINQDGEWSIEPQFKRAGDFTHGLAPAQDAESGNFGYIDDTGYWVIPPQYSDVNLNIMQ